MTFKDMFDKTELDLQNWMLKKYNELSATQSNAALQELRELSDVIEEEFADCVLDDRTNKVKDE